MKRFTDFMLAPFVLVMSLTIIMLGWVLGVRVKITKKGELVGHLKWFHFDRVPRK